MAQTKSLFKGAVWLEIENRKFKCPSNRILDLSFSGLFTRHRFQLILTWQHFQTTSITEMIIVSLILTTISLGFFVCALIRLYVHLHSFLQFKTVVKVVLRARIQSNGNLFLRSQKIFLNVCSRRIYKILAWNIVWASKTKQNVDVT